MSVKKVFEYMLTGVVIYFCAALLFGVSRDILWAFNLLAFLGAMTVLAVPISLFVVFLRWLLKSEADPAEEMGECTCSVVKGHDKGCPLFGRGMIA